MLWMYCNRPCFPSPSDIWQMALCHSNAIEISTAGDAILGSLVVTSSPSKQVTYEGWRVVPFHSGRFQLPPCNSGLMGTGFAGKWRVGVKPGKWDWDKGNTSNSVNFRHFCFYFVTGQWFSMSSQDIYRNVMWIARLNLIHQSLSLCHSGSVVF